MKLNVENEGRSGFEFAHGRLVGRFDFGNSEERAEDCVHCQERRHHPAACAQKFPPGQSELRRQTRRVGKYPPFNCALGDGLGERRKFFVGNQAGRDRYFRLQALAHARTNAECMTVQFHHRLLCGRCRPLREVSGLRHVTMKACDA